jgi:hypothetical protein
MQAHWPLRPQDIEHFHHHTVKVKREILLNETCYEYTAYICLWQFLRYLCNLSNDVLLAVKGLVKLNSTVPTCLEHYIFLLPDFIISDLWEDGGGGHWLIRVISQHVYMLLWEIGRVATHTLSHPSSAVRGTLLASVPMNCVASCLQSSVLHKPAAQQSVSFIQCGNWLSKHPHVT